jgi:hypothetical protein
LRRHHADHGDLAEEVLKFHPQTKD